MAEFYNPSVSKAITEHIQMTVGQSCGAHRSDAYEMQPTQHLPDPESFRDISFMLSTPAPAPSSKSFGFGFHDSRKSFRTILLSMIALLVIAAIVSSTVLGLHVATSQAKVNNLTGVQNETISSTLFSVPTEPSTILAIRQIPTSSTTTQTSIPAGGVFTARPTIPTPTPSSPTPSSIISTSTSTSTSSSPILPPSSTASFPAQQTLIFKKGEHFVLPGKKIAVVPIGAIMVGIWALILIGASAIGAVGKIKARNEYRGRVAVIKARAKAQAEVEGWEMSVLPPGPVAVDTNSESRRPVTMRGFLGEVL